MTACRASRPVRVVAILLLLALAACGTTARRGGEPAAEQKVVRPGGYYLDDGPVEVDPALLDRVPDAIPRSEPIKASTTKPYSALGQTYVPMSALAPYTARGIASWYGKRYHGQPTASGEIYDMFGMTAAHPTLPIPSYVRVTQIDNGRSVVLRVNDRGPFHADRLIDLSYTAAYKLGLLSRGRGLVQVESLLPPFDAAAAPPASDRAAAAVLPPRPASAGDSSPSDPPSPGTYLQLGAFALAENAHAFVARLASEVTWLAAKTIVRREGRLFRVQAGPFQDAKEAAQAAAHVRQALTFEPMIVTR